MPSLNNYHILISHSWGYNSDYQTIKEWLDSAPYFRWSDYSVPLTNPIDANSKRELQQKIDNKIAVCSCIIVLSGMSVSYSEWIDFEIRTALKYSKPIIAVKPWGQQRIPSIITAFADEIVGWNSDSVINAVRAHGLIG